MKSIKLPVSVPPPLPLARNRKAQKRKPRNSSKKIFGIRFQNPELLLASLAHPSYRNERPELKLEDFDRLEFFGDTILNFVICRELYRKYPQANEGFLSRLRSILVSRKILSRVATEIHLLRHLKLGKSLKCNFKFAKAKILSDSLEALFAALYWDQGPACVERFTLKHFADYLDAKRLLRLDPNPKSTLQELCQREWQAIPTYTHQLTPHGIKTEVAIQRYQKACAYGRTRQEAEEKSARLLIRKIRQLFERRSKRYSSGIKLRRIF
ncbi:MAG: ribonuclease III [Candidatus Omnitrophica bacterium]|nr:ribonuclease III [Candidatus Omnitrophota bacterium]